MMVNQKREIVRRFRVGERVESIAGRIADWQYCIVERVLRDFMNGKFSLEPRRKTRIGPARGEL